MGYIGTPVQQALTKATSQYFNGTGSQTVFTLNRAVNVPEDLEVFVNNIQQEPGVGKSYTATGTTLTFDAAPSSGTGNIYVIYRGSAEVTRRLEHDPNAALAATTGTFSGAVTFGAGANFGDNDKAIFGAGSDLQIYHDGSQSYIKDVGTGQLRIAASDILFSNAAVTENIMFGAQDGAVTLYHNGAAKLATTATGVNVTGAISSNKGSAGTLATFSDGVNSNFVIETASLITTVGNTGGSTALAFKSSNTERMRIDSNGRVAIGTTTAYRLLEVQSSIADTDVASFSTSADGGQGLLFSVVTSSDKRTRIRNNTSTQYAMAFEIAGSEKMRIDTSGRLLVGNTGYNIGQDGVYLQSAGSVFSRNTTSNATQVNFANPNSVVGTISTSGTSTSYNTSSDYRLKENVTADWDATTRLKQLNPVRFNFIADADTTVDGFLAHEVQSVVPEAISGTHNEVDDEGNPVYQGIDQSKLVPLLVKTIQELEARIAALEAN